MLGWCSDVRIRRGKLSDAGALTEVFRESWQLAYRGIIPHAQLESMIRRRGRQWWTTALRRSEGLLVLDFDGKVAGYATFGTARAKDSENGEIYELYLAPQYQGLGLGELLFEACRDKLDARGAKGLVVWALEQNEQASDFYWRRGGRPFAATIERVGGARLEKIAFGWG